MEVKLTKFWVKNFKSLKDVEIKLRDFNLLIGPNASGKTNIIEAFKLLEKIIYHYTPYTNPFLEWWGYQNVIWRGNEELPITIGFEMQVSEYKASYEITITGVGGRFEILHENISIPKVVKIERRGNMVIVKHNPKFIEEKWDIISPIPIDYRIRPKTLSEKDKLITQFAEINISTEPLFNSGWSASYHDKIVLVTPYLPYIKGQRLMIISPIIKVFEKFRERHEMVSIPLVVIIRYLRLILLRQLNFKAIKTPQSVKRDLILSEDGSNLANVLHTIYMERGEIPPRIHVILNAIFGDDKEITIKPALTEDGRVYIKVFEGDFPLNPPMVPDGLWKVLTILTAIETKPLLIIIDELENSLHPRAIEYIVNELKNSKCTVIATTHSPVVIDMVDPEDLILVERNWEGATKVRRVIEPKKVKQWLTEHGITLSEKWLYGEL